VELRYEPDVLVVESSMGRCLRWPSAGVGVRRRAVSGRQGLTGLRERAGLVGGMVHAGPAAGGGFRGGGLLPYGPQGPGASDGGPGRLGSGRTETFVDAGNDFRGQIGGVLLGDGGTVTDWQCGGRVTRARRGNAWMHTATAAPHGGRSDVTERND
jgi:hypothetical protein